MPILQPDDRRRITLPAEVLDDAEQRFIAIKTPQGILLKPIPKDPIQALEEWGKKIPKDLTLKDLKRIAQEEGEKEALGL